MDTRPRETRENRRPSKEELERQLDEALKATFPASDAIAVGQPTGTRPLRPLDRMPARIDKDLVDRLADQVPGKGRKRKRAANAR